MHKKQINRLLAAALSIVMVLSLAVIPAGAAKPMGTAPVPEVPVEASGSAGLSAARPVVSDAPDAELLAATASEVDVWDFGAEQLANTAEYKFNNHLNVEVINGWYEGLVDKDGNAVEVKTGQQGNNFPHVGFTDAAGLSYRTGTDENPAYNHRLRTDNTALTRDSSDTCTGDANDPYVSAVGEDGKPAGATYHGILYSNSSANPAVHFALECESGDIITLIVSSNGTNSLINFTNAETEEVEGSDVFTRASRTKMQTMTFHAKSDGVYNINSINEKLVVARIYRQHATPVAVSGKVTEAEGIPAGYSLVFTNTTTGAEIVAPVASAAYSTTLLAPYTYDVSLKDANGYAVLVGAEVTVDVTDTSVTNNVVTQGVDRVAVTGTISGLDDDAKAKLVGNLLFTPTGDGIVYIPEVTIEGETYTVMVEKDMPITISAKKINDWEITTQNITDRVFTEDTTLDLAFAKKAVYPVTITTTGMTAADLAGTKITFTNLHEAGETEDQTAVPFDPYGPDNLTGSIYNYSYSFTGTTGVELRDGVYDVTVDDPHQKATANLKVNGGAATLTIPFTTPAPYVSNGVHDFTPKTATLAQVDGISGPFTPHGSGHGLTGKGDMTISLAELSTITIGGCCYSQVDGTLLVPTATAGGQAVEVVTTKEGVANSEDPEYVISNVEGDVVVTFPSTGSSYIHSIKVEPAVAPEFNGYNFIGDNVASNTQYASTIPGLTVTGGVKHGDQYGMAMYGGGSLDFNVTDACTVTVKVSYKQGTVWMESDATHNNETSAWTDASDGVDAVFEIAEAGPVSIKTGANTYISEILVEYANFEVPVSEWNFNNGSLPATNFPDNTAATEWEGLTVEVGTTGKFAPRTSAWAQFQTGAKLIIPIYGGVEAGTELTISINGYKAGHVKVGEKSNTVEGDYEDFTITVDDSHTVVIEAGNSDGYIGGIKVNYPEGTLPEPDPDIVYTVGTDKEFQTINAALAAAEQAKRAPGQRITIAIDPGNYEEQLYIKVKDLTLKNASATPSIALKNKGVDIDANAVRITWYYGHGYTYYSMTNGHRYDADVLAANKANGYASYINAGAGSTDDSYWNASVLVAADGLHAEGIIFENSFNQYVSAKSLEDVIEPQGAQAKEGNVARASMKTVGDTKVQEKAYVERAGALSIKSGTNIFFDNCAFISRQDTFYGNEGSKVACYGCDIYGGTDYIYGGMTLVAAKCNLLFNTSEDNNDVGYITAAQQKAANTPGYLLWNCTVDSTEPGVNTASAYRSKPGYFGRPWETTGEALFYATDIKATDPVYFGVPLDKETKHSTSLITPTGWNSSLGGTSARSEEMGTVEYYKDVNNSADRVTWATAVTTAPTVAGFLGDWDPFEGKDMAIANQTPVDAPAAAKPITKLTINQKAQEMGVGDTLDLTVAVEPADATDKSLDWTSSDLSVLNVDENGKVTAVGGGAAKIKVSSKNHMVNAEIVLTVIIPVDSVTLNKTTINMGAGRTTKLVATVAPENASNQNVTFASSDETVVTVGADGKVTAKGAGTATITATSEDGGKTATCAVTITGTIPTIPDDPGDDPSDDPAEKTPAEKLADAIKAAEAAAAATKESADGKNVAKSKKWVTPEDMATYKAAIQAAKDVAGADPAADDEALTAALETLNAATDAFKAAQKPGSQASSSTPAYGTGTKPDGTQKDVTTTATNPSGDTVTTVTKPDGEKTFTVETADGEKLAEVTIPATVSGKHGFVDVPEDHWAAKAIDRMADLGMVKGVNDEGTLFDMNALMTRGAIATMFQRLANGSEDMANPFADTEGHWAAAAVAWANKAGVVTGYSTEAFGPDDSITRGQMAVMLARFADLLGLDTKANLTVLDDFTDGAADSWAVKGLAWCVEKGIMQGRGNGELDHTSAITRCEATAMFDRMIGLLQK